MLKNIFLSTFSENGRGGSVLSRSNNSCQQHVGGASQTRIE